MSCSRVRRPWRSFHHAREDLRSTLLPGWVRRVTTLRAARYLRVPDAARYLGVSRRTFYDHVRKDVPCVKIGGVVAFDVTDLDAWAEAHKELPTQADERPPVSTGTELARRKWTFEEGRRGMHGEFAANPEGRFVFDPERKLAWDPVSKSFKRKKETK